MEAAVAIAEGRRDFSTDVLSRWRRAAAAAVAWLVGAKKRKEEREAQREAVQCGTCTVCCPSGTSATSGGRRQQRPGSGTSSEASSGSVCLGLRRLGAAWGGHTGAAVSLMEEEAVGLDLELRRDGVAMQVHVVGYDAAKLQHEVMAVAGAAGSNGKRKRREVTSLALWDHKIVVTSVSGLGAAAVEPFERTETSLPAVDVLEALERYTASAPWPRFRPRRHC